MNNRLALVVAVVLGVLSIVLIRNYVKNLEDRHRYDLGLKPFLVASRDIAPGTVITEGDIENRDLPGRFTDEALRGAQIVEKTTILNAKTVTPISAGQVFLRYHFPDLTVGTKGPPLRGRWTGTWRAITIPMDPGRAVAGLIRPGDYVDIIATIPFQTLEGDQTIVTRVLLKKALIVATDDKTQPEDVRPGERFTTVTLRLEPKDCNRLMWALAKGGSLVCSYVQQSAPEEGTWNSVISETLFDEVKDEVNAAKQGGRR